MTEQPEALFLADELEAPVGTVISCQVDKRAAAELRRLHEENERLRALIRLDQRISDDPIYIASDGGFYPMPRQRKPLEGEEP